jgi:hypothetical protein
MSACQDQPLEIPHKTTSKSSLAEILTISAHQQSYFYRVLQEAHYTKGAQPEKPMLP